MHGAAEKNPVAVSANGTILAGFVLIALLFVVGGSWAHFARLSSAVIAQGQVTVEGRTKTVQHPDGGVVAQILIGEGDRVERGDLLLLLDDTLLKAERGVHRGRLRESLARKARLEAERDDAGAIPWGTLSPKPFGLSLDPRVRAGQQNLFEARRQTRLGRISMLTERVAQFENQIDGTEALNRSRQRQVVSLDTELEAVRALKEKGLVPASRVLELERRRETLVGQIAGHDAEVARVRNAIGEARIEMLQIDREFRQDVLGTPAGCRGRNQRQRPEPGGDARTIATGRDQGAGVGRGSRSQRGDHRRRSCRRRGGRSHRAANRSVRGRGVRRAPICRQRLFRTVGGFAVSGLQSAQPPPT